MFTCCNTILNSKWGPFLKVKIFMSAKTRKILEKVRQFCYWKKCKPCLYPSICLHPSSHTYKFTCMSTYMHTYMYWLMHACLHTYTHKYIHVHINTLSWMSPYIHTLIYIYRLMQVYIHTYIHTYNIPTYSCMSACIYMDVRTYIHKAYFPTYIDLQ